MPRQSTGIALLLAALQVAPVCAQEHDHAAASEGRAGRSVSAASRPTWTNFPILLPAMGRERGAVQIRAANLAPAVLDVYSPGADVAAGRRQLAMAPEGVTVGPKSPSQGNYHWLMAREETADGVKVASTAHYFSNPGPSPEEVLVASKSELEIVPQPLPREHSAYRESEKWQFLVRFNGRALESKEVVMETEAGSRVKMMTNEIGMATVVFPRDQAPAKAGEDSHRPKPARFVLAVAHEAEGKRYLTAFNYTYRKDPDRDRSLGAGVGFLVLGMAGALPLLRRRKDGQEVNQNA